MRDGHTRFLGDADIVASLLLHAGEDFIFALSQVYDRGILLDEVLVFSGYKSGEIARYEWLDLHEDDSFFLRELACRGRECVERCGIGTHRTSDREEPVLPEPDRPSLEYRIGEELSSIVDPEEYAPRDISSLTQHDLPVDRLPDRLVGESSEECVDILADIFWKGFVDLEYEGLHGRKTL